MLLLAASTAAKGQNLQGYNSLSLSPTVLKIAFQLAWAASPLHLVEYRLTISTWVRPIRSGAKTNRQTDMPTDRQINTQKLYSFLSTVQREIGLQKTQTKNDFSLNVLSWNYVRNHGSRAKTQVMPLKFKPLWKAAAGQPYTLQFQSLEICKFDEFRNVDRLILRL